MTKRHSINALITISAILLMAATALAQGAKTYAVLPFTYNGPQKYEYFSKALQASLDSDLEWLGQVEPTTKSLEDIAIPTDKGGALNALRSLGIDYLVYGDIAVLGKKAHIKIETIAQDGNSWIKKGEMGIDGITSWLDAQGKAIQGDAFNRPGYGTAETAVVENKTVRTKAPTSSPFITADGGQYTTDSLNPQFRYEGGTETQGRWRSQTLPFFSHGMAIADGDADGRNEVFILQESSISAYRFKDGKLEHLASFDLPANTMSIRLEIADLNRDGTPEFIVGAYQFENQGGIRAPRGTPRSSILSFEGGSFKYVIKKYDKFLGVLRIPPTYMPILVAQNKGHRDLFDKHVNEAFIRNDEIHLGQEIKLPPFGNVYNLTYLPDGMGYNYVVVNNSHKLVTYGQSFERLNETDETYNSSGIVIETADKMAGMGGGKTEEHGVTYNIPFRMIATPLTSTTKYELLVNKDISATAQVFQNYKYFTQGEIHSLVFDQVGMNLAWKTRRIKGQVSDVALADLNNDGNKQLCVLVNTFTGVGYGNRKAVVLAYDLNLEQPAAFVPSATARMFKERVMRKLLPLLATGLILACLLAATAMAGTTVTYANFPPAKTFPCVQMEHWKIEVEKRTGGGLSVQTFPGSTLLGAKNMLRGVQTGQADIGCISIPYYPGVFPLMSAVNLPVAFTSTEAASLTMWDLFQKYQPKEFKDVKVLTMFTSAPSQIMSKEPIKNLADFNGMELRASGSILRILSGLGAQGVGMPMSQTPEALQKGVVKGLVSSFDVLKDFNFAESCRYATITNLPVYPFAVIMNKAKWEALPADVKKVLEDLGREQAQWTGRYLDNHINDSLAWSKEKYQVEVFQLTAGEQDEVKGLGKPLIDDWKTEATSAGLDAEAILADLLALKTKYESKQRNLKAPPHPCGGVFFGIFHDRFPGQNKRCDLQGPGRTGRTVSHIHDAPGLCQHGAPRRMGSCAGHLRTHGLHGCRGSRVFPRFRPALQGTHRRGHPSRPLPGTGPQTDRRRNQYRFLLFLPVGRSGNRQVGRIPGADQ
eukprot:TRINITY_DN11180_c0_g1_i1.p1 TRINITY_DN11180_c0_g1~~TRINITY_DN11180_c0_g1_i1.p1  ORF type:complete len:1044 (+),score=279.53 TRINITY_DN11180_c0_g1_i1:590-3721(+)